MNQIIIQIIGFIGYLFLGYSFFKKDKSKILLFQIFAHIFFSIHYYLLSGYTGAICNFVSLFGIITIYLLNNKDSYYKYFIVLLISIALIITGLTSYKNIYFIFPIVASIITQLSFLLKNTSKIRISGIISAACWLIYAIVYKSYAAIIFETILIISTIIAYIKNSKIT